MRSHSRRRTLLRTATALAGAAALTAATAMTASAAPGGWTETGSYNVDSLSAGQGLTGLPDGSLVYRGLASIPLDLRIQGWEHIGDPDAADGYIFDAYQGGDPATSKMYAVTTPAGQRYVYTHALDTGEKLNNSFAAVSPDKQWLVSGEWGAQSRLQVFPAPLLNASTPATGGALAQAGQITLNRTVRDIQGCDFVADTRLVCTSNDSTKTLFADDKPMFQVDLPHALNGTAVTGTVTSLGPLPQRSTCTGTFEAEGVDYDPQAKKLRAEVIQPGICVVATTVHEYAPTTG